MKRRHQRKDAVRFCAEARRLRPDIVFGADLIAGFPTETEEMLANSLHLIDDCGLTFLHVFPFSPRHGTPAARMPQVVGTAIKERAARLRRAGETALAGYLHRQIGLQVELLVEREQLGRTPQYAELELSSPAAPGSLITGRVTGSTGKRLRGEALTTMCAA
jgi:threonylcarbamoyladenosine tRNA methylthiotransferase MtaB